MNLAIRKLLFERLNSWLGSPKKLTKGTRRIVCENLEARTLLAVAAAEASLSSAAIIAHQATTEGRDAPHEFSLAIAQPDLVLTAAQVTAIEGTTISCSYTVKNIGTATANLNGPTGANSDNVKIRGNYTYLIPGTNRTTAASFEFAVIDIPARLVLQPGQSYTGSIKENVTAPYRINKLTFRIDATNILAEVKETNNAISPVFSQESLAVGDLVVNYINVKTVGTKSTIRPSFKNDGTAKVELDGATNSLNDNAFYNVYLSNDAILDANDLLVTKVNMGDLKNSRLLEAGANYTDQGVTIDNSRAYVIVQVDASQAVLEGNEANNVMAQRIVPMPDLTVNAVQVTAYSATQVSFQVTITNIGNAYVDLTGADHNPDTAADNTKLGIQAFFSADKFFNPATDLRAGRGYSTLYDHITHVGVLAPGDSFVDRFSYTFTLPTFAPSAYPYLLVVLDSAKAITEISENNNVGVANVVMPDLTVSTVKVQKTTSGVHIDAMLKNIGTSAISLYGTSSSLNDDAEIKFFQSSETTLDVVTATEIATFHVPTGRPTLNPGDAVTLSFDLDFPASDRYYVFAYIDWSDCLIEANELNNANLGQVL